jgi:hypothetical protein
MLHKQVRAFGLFMEDLVARLEGGAAETTSAAVLRGLAGRCAAVGGARPRFAEVVAELAQIVPVS